MIAFFTAPARRLAARPPVCPITRPPRPTMVEGLEGRTMLSVSPGTLPAVLHGNGPAITHTLQHAVSSVTNNAANTATSVLPVQITGVGVNNGNLVALGKVGSQVFSVPLTLTASPSATDPAVNILNLHIDPIHLNLLGLQVDTSAICLNVGAQPGSGNLLGNLLSGVANALNSGSTLGGILGGLSSTNLTSLTGGLTGLLNSVFGQLFSTGAVSGVGSTGTGGHGGGNGNGNGHAQTQGDCNILNLSVGPVNLNLLGLTVGLDNCANGPVTVDITAKPGNGNLLGNLLCSLSRALDAGNTSAIDQLIGRIANRLGQLV